MPPHAKWVKATTYRRDSPEVAKLCLKPRSHRARRRASTRQIKLMLKIVSIQTDRVDARQVIFIHPMSDVSLSYT